VTATLDTNLLLRLALRDVEAQYCAVRGLVTRPGARYRVTDTCAGELVFALSRHYAMSRVQVAAVVQAFLADSAIEANAGLLEQVLSRWVTHPSLSYTDCYLAEETAASGNTPLLTFDKKLASQHPGATLVPSDGPPGATGPAHAVPPT
jgi:predicted nucleic-acid-binding protein